MWRLAIALLALLGSSTTSAHDHTPPWLSGESLDKGLSIVIHAPSFLRTDRPFPLRVQVRKIDAPNDVLVQSFRLDRNTKQTPATKLLPAPSGLLEKTRLLQESLHTTASRHDRPGTLRLAKSYTDALRSLTQHAATAQAMGLSWIVFTDHSNIHGSRFGTDFYTDEQFNQGQAWKSSVTPTANSKTTIKTH